MATVFEAIRAERETGRVRCGPGAGGALLEVAASHGLRADPTLYVQIDRATARRLLVQLLHREVAYSGVLMPLTRAEALADAFLRETEGPGCRYFTNVVGTTESVRETSWNPATDATFDMGVLVLTERGSACFWIEEED